ncbi:MAG: penicillin-binding protein 1C [Desulfobulbaceae bacterium A2]|nr:MAG: penicillin-binding protein 1C [Desulfobulbaceae bacterium A2]
MILTTGRKLPPWAWGILPVFLAGCAWWYWGLALLPAPDFSSVREGWRSSEARLLDREGRLLHELRLDHTVRRLAWTPLAGISPALVRAVILAEDHRLYRHHGVDWLAVAASLRDRLSGRPLRGASTLTMQLAARLDPSLRAAGGRRDPRQKLRQMRAALALERRWSKEEILEAYCNLVDYRGELQGIAATARAFFGKAPSALTEAESLVLAALLPSPGRAPERIGARACVLATSAGQEALCAEVRQLAVDVLTRPRPIHPAAELAPHLARHLLRRAGETVGTTLDAGLQRQVHEILRRHLLTLVAHNVRDAAALVVDTPSGEVLAYVGAAGPGSTAAQVDGVRARRQAGSTLKPFLYGLALEQRYLTAASILDDSPLNLETALGVYMPQNYERDYKGRVSLRTALASSLNIPAVRTLMLVGLERFRDRLWQLGYQGIVRTGEYYGWSLALGSAEVSLMEQVNAYRSLANGGLSGPLRLVTDAGPMPDEPRRVMPEDAAFVITDILADPAARALTFGLASPLATRGWSAVKTGTSKDMRDNWCIGCTPAVTVGVWVGNFEGDAMRDVSGISGAAPVWHEIIALLAEERPGPGPAAPAGLERRQVSFSGAVEPPRQEWFLAGTAVDRVEPADPRRQSARIDSPADGLVVALDPDIPPGHQAVPFSTSLPLPEAVFELDGRVVAPAGSVHRWPPVPGRHCLRLLDKTGRELDQVNFQVR